MTAAADKSFMKMHWPQIATTINGFCHISVHTVQ